MSEEKKVITSNPRRFGNNSFVTDAFLDSCKAGEKVSYEHPDYVCMSRKAYKTLTQARIDTDIEVMGIYYAVIKDLYGKEIAEMIQKRVNSSQRNASDQELLELIEGEGK